MPNIGPFLSVVMPAYNEEQSIEQVIRDHALVLEKLRDLVPDWEIVCVDDGSTDHTPELLHRLQRQVPSLRVIHQANGGIYSAFSRVYREARGQYIYSTGSDGQWPAENLVPMLEALQRGADLIVGVRTNRSEIYSLGRRLVSFAFNSLPRVCWGVALRDANGIKLGLRELFQFELISRSLFFEAERIIKVQRCGYRVAFVPIRFLPRSGGKASGASWRNIITSTRDLFRCIWFYGWSDERWCNPKGLVINRSDP